ncbi:MAG: response regulator [Candidatus Kapabacteria bacterium]|nr:response regulator [Candidatus Kapabacteria bacterium]
MQTVCLIEDDRITRKLFVMLLERAGFAVHDFDNGAAALDWLGAHAADVVLSNIVLPEGVSGTDVLRQIRTGTRGTQTPVFALTSFVRRGERERYLEMGFDGCVAKPIDPQTFGEDFRGMIAGMR